MSHRHDRRGVDWSCYGCKDPSKASDKETREMAINPDATASNFPNQDNYPNYKAYAELLRCEVR